MPCLEVSMPRVDVEVRRRLAKGLTDAFVRCTRFGADIFGIRFFDYGHGEAAVGGELCDPDAGVRYVHALLYCPRLGRATKQQLARELTDAFAAALGPAASRPVLHICEHPYDNVVVEGRLLSDAHAECARRAFYYELPRD